MVRPFYSYLFQNYLYRVSIIQAKAERLGEFSWVIIKRTHIIIIRRYIWIFLHGQQSIHVAPDEVNYVCKCLWFFCTALLRTHLILGTQGAKISITFTRAKKHTHVAPFHNMFYQQSKLDQRRHWMHQRWWWGRELLAKAWFLPPMCQCVCGVLSLFVFRRCSLLLPYLPYNFGCKWGRFPAEMNFNNNTNKKLPFCAA